MSDVDDRVKEMAKLTVSFNRISEIHEKNMKMYPLIFFDGVKGVKIEYDLHTQSDVDDSDGKKIVIKTPIVNHFVNYYLDIDPQSQNSNIERRFSTLESSIRSLFWKNIIVRVFINDKLSYESGKK